MGSPAIAAWIAHLTFWVLVVRGWMTAELGNRGTIIALAFWLIAYISRPFVPYGVALFPSLVALADIALVLVIVRGDVRIT